MHNTEYQGPSLGFSSGVLLEERCCCKREWLGFRCTGFSVAQGAILHIVLVASPVNSPNLSRRRAMLKASEGMCLIRTGCPKLDISNKNLTMAFSSSGVRYCWLWALSSIDAPPCLRRWSVERGTLLFSEIARYGADSPAEKTSASAWLAWSMIAMVVVMRKAKPVPLGILDATRAAQSCAVESPKIGPK